MRAFEQIDHLHFVIFNSPQRLGIRGSAQKHFLTDAGLAGNGFKHLVARIGKSIQLIENEQIKTEGIPIKLMRRTHDQVRIGDLGHPFTDRNHLQFGKVFRKPACNFDHDLPAADRKTDFFALGQVPADAF